VKFITASHHQVHMTPRTFSRSWVSRCCHRHFPKLYFFQRRSTDLRFVTEDRL